MPAGGHAFWLSAADSTRLRCIIWNTGNAGPAQARGTVFLFGGRTEFAEKYFEIIRALMDRGYAVAALDWRGQGLSQRALADPRKGHVSDFAGFDDDIGTFMAEVAPHMPRPWIGLAHSMGGNALLRFMHDRPDVFAACVMSAPMLGLNLGSPFVARLLGAIARVGQALGLGAHYVPGGSPKASDETSFEDNILTHDPARYAAYQAQIRAEPALALGSPTYGWLNAALRSVRQLARPDYLAAIRTPVLILLAQKDRLVAADSLRHAAALLPKGEIVEVAGASHEIMIETDEIKAVFWRAFDDFIARTAPSDPPSPRL